MSNFDLKIWNKSMGPIDGELNSTYFYSRDKIVITVEKISTMPDSIFIKFEFDTKDAVDTVKIELSKETFLDLFNVLNNFQRKERSSWDLSSVGGQSSDCK